MKWKKGEIDWVCIYWIKLRFCWVYFYCVSFCLANFIQFSFHNDFYFHSENISVWMNVLPFDLILKHQNNIYKYCRRCEQGFLFHANCIVNKAEHILCVSRTKCNVQNLESKWNKKKIFIFLSHTKQFNQRSIKISHAILLFFFFFIFV